MGYKQASRAGGCPVCGLKKKSDGGSIYRRYKTLILPSGLKKEFIAGTEYTVNENDFNFLMSLKYEIDGITKPMFKAV